MLNIPLVIGSKLIEYFNKINETDINLNWKDCKINNYILESKLNNKLSKINLILCIKHRSNYIKTNYINILDESLLENLTEIERNYKIMKNYSEIVCQIVNEFIKKDLDVIKPNGGEEIVSINLSYLYNIKLKSMENIDCLNLDKLFPRTKELEIREKILKNSIIISTLWRDPEITFFISNKKNEETEISKTIKYTKGYKICLSSKIVKELSNLRYISKTYETRPKNIIETDEITTEDFLKNKNIWIRPFERAIDEPKEIEYDNFMKKKIDPNYIINYLNKMNNTKLSININLLNSINSLANIKGNDSWKLISKNQLINNIYIIDRIKPRIIFDDDEFSNIELNSIIQDAATYELIKKQATDIIKYNNNLFYLEYKLDPRYRIYPINWPLNYQLNHIARAITQIKQNIDKEEVIKNFMCKYKRWNLKDCELFPFYTKLKESKKKIEKITNNKIYVESIIQLLISLSDIKSNDEERKLIESLKTIDELENMNIKNINKWCKEKEWDNKKVLKLLTITNIMKLINENKINDALNCTVYLDASNNSLQIVAYRLGVINEFLLKLLNIYDNDTEYNGIYDYIDKKISECPKNPKILELYKNLPKIDISKIHSKSDAKRRLMPAPYGKTLFTSIKEDRKELLTHKEGGWSKLTFDEQTKISTYLWKRSLNILKENGLDIDEYKKLFVKETKRYWKNNISLPVVINNTYSSERVQLTEEFNKLLLVGEQLYDELEISDKEIFDKLKNEIGERIKKSRNENLKDNGIIERVKEEMKKNKSNKKLYKTMKNFENKIKTVRKVLIDEKEFNVRRKIKIEDKTFTLRIIKNIKKIDEEGIKKSLMPSSVHSWDSCALIKIKKICNELGIEITTIHDSIGCQLWAVPIVRIIFIIINIEMINECQKKEVYPYKEKKINKINRRRMLGSRNIFKL